MKPYYEQDGIVIYHGDCRDVLPSIGGVDAIITDPPYNVGRKYGTSTDDSRSVDEYVDWCGDVFRVCRAQCRVFALTPGIVNVSIWCALEDPAWMLAWLKPAATLRSPFGYSNWEPVLVWGHERVKKGDDWLTDVVTAPIIMDPALSGHPCPKPELWAYGVIVRVTKSGDICDPFMGTGATMAAAKRLGRKAIGIEIEERYCEIAAKRLAQGALPLDMTA